MQYYIIFISYRVLSRKLWHAADVSVYFFDLFAFDGANAETRFLPTANFDTGASLMALTFAANSNANVWFHPPKSFSIFGRPSTLVGVHRILESSVVTCVTTPHWPCAFWPHANTCPSLVNAMECFSPSNKYSVMCGDAEYTIKTYLSKCMTSTFHYLYIHEQIEWT